MAKESRFGDPQQTLYLIDISSFIFRAFFAIRSLSNRKGEPTNAIYGVANMISRLAEEANPELLSVVYDSKEPSFRRKMYAEYKANRSETPDDLIPQFDRIERMIKCFEIHSYRESGIEADDVIGTLAKKWCKESPKHKVIIVSGDKDLLQLVDDRVSMWDTLSDKIYTPFEVEEKFGVKPTQIQEYLGLVGDSSDNIPGVPSIGPKSASDLLKQYGDVEAILKAAEKGEIIGKKGETLKANAADARLSVDLATLRCELPVEVDREKMAYHFHVNAACADFFREMDFHKLVEKWEGRGALKKVSDNLVISSASNPSTAGEQMGFGSMLPSAPAVKQQILADANRFRCINTEKGLAEVLNGLEKAGEFGFDLETTSLNPRAAEIVGIALCYDPEFGVYIPIGHRGTDVPQLQKELVFKALRPFLENPKYRKVGQNLKYDFSVLHELGISPDGIGADTMIADYVLEPEGRHNLELLALKYLDYPVKTYEEVCGKGKDQIGFDLVPVDQATHYSAEDAWVALKIWHAEKPKLEAEKLMDVFTEIDLPMVAILSKMERQGVEIDSDYLAALSREFQKELTGIENKIQEYVKRPINLNSPKQLAQLLFEELKLPTQTKTKTGFSTDASVLEALAPLHEIPRLLLENREIAKLKGTYVDPLPLLKDAKTGRIHASFHQTVAATGRLSGSDPNLQNIPTKTERGRKIRKAFIAGPGNVLFSADYSQIELRLLAHMSGDTELVKSFLADEDVHRRTASEIFEIKPEAVTDEQRSIAKAINFGLMYGKTPFGLSQELKISRKEAQDTIDRYFARYKGVKYFLDNQIQEAREKGYVITLLGRKRALPDILAKNGAMRAVAERMAMNSPIQGTAADLMKLAMIRLDQSLEKHGLKSKLLIQVHDEVVLECPEDEVEKVQKVVIEAMENALDGRIQLLVPLRVNTAIGKNWNEL